MACLKVNVVHVRFCLNDVNGTADFCEILGRNDEIWQGNMQFVGSAIQRWGTELMNGVWMVQIF